VFHAFTATSSLGKKNFFFLGDEHVAFSMSVASLAEHFGHTERQY
jgi:hypothetical protein